MLHVFSHKKFAPFFETFLYNTSRIPKPFRDIFHVFPTLPPSFSFGVFWFFLSFYHIPLHSIALTIHVCIHTKKTPRITRDVF